MIMRMGIRYPAPSRPGDRVGVTAPSSGVDESMQARLQLDALGGLAVPIIADVECGHVLPYLPLVKGARCQVVHTGDRDEITQVLD